MEPTAPIPAPPSLRRAQHLPAGMADQSQLEPAAAAAKAGRRWPRPAIAATALAVSALVSAPGAVAALSPAVTRSADGTTGVDLRLVDNVYRGQVVDLAAIEALNAGGRARFSVASHELGCQGLMLYFDTEAQADQYGRGYLQRQQAQRSASTDATGDPCADSAGAPSFRPTR